MHAIDEWWIKNCTGIHASFGVTLKEQWKTASILNLRIPIERTSCSIESEPYDSPLLRISKYVYWEARSIREVSLIKSINGNTPLPKVHIIRISDFHFSCRPRLYSDTETVRNEDGRLSNQNSRPQTLPSKYNVLVNSKIVTHQTSTATQKRSLHTLDINCPHNHDQTSKSS